MLPPATAALLDRLDADLRRLLQGLLTTPAAVLDKEPGPNRWSVYDVMQHLIIAEGNSYRYLVKKLQDPQQMQRAGLGAAIRAALLVLNLRYGGKFKAPAMADKPAFDPVESLAQLSGKWEEQRQQLRALLAAQPAEVFRLAAYRHPVAGRISLHAMLRFFDAHFQRHLRQINNNLKELGA